MAAGEVFTMNRNLGTGRVGRSEFVVVLNRGGGGMGWGL